LRINVKKESISVLPKLRLIAERRTDVQGEGPKIKIGGKFFFPTHAKK
jgi:hypothetical protein